VVEANLPVNVYLLALEHAHIPYLTKIAGENYRREAALMAFFAETQQVCTPGYRGDGQNFSMDAGCLAHVFGRFFDAKAGRRSGHANHERPKKAHSEGKYRVAGRMCLWAVCPGAS
jgi:hypothetical protein